MSDGDEFEEIRITGLAKEDSDYDPESELHEYQLQLSAEPRERWIRIFDGELKLGTDPHSGPVEAEVRGDRLVVPGVTRKTFDETLLTFLKKACRRTNDEYREVRARRATDAEAEEAHRAEMDAKREKAQKETAELAERIETEATDDSQRRSTTKAARIPTRDFVKVRMEKLTEQAEELARSHGHNKLRWQDIAYGPDKATTFRDGRCTLCDSSVRISADPESIEGDAVSTACPRES